jgi:hypothetical protein
VPTRTLSRGAARVVTDAVDDLFDRVKGRVLGPDFIRSRGDKNIFVGHRRDFSIPGLYRRAAAEEATRPNEATLNSLAKIAESYLDAERERTKARVLKAVQDWVSRDGTDMATVLGGELAGLFTQATKAVARIVDSESTTARNMGTLEGITKVAAAANVSDPAVYFVTVRDHELCEECRRLHLMPDGVTPRVWKLSDVSSGYHQRGEETPSIGGLHPHCRCSLAYLAIGFGFDSVGRVVFIGVGHDELARQLAEERTEKTT